MISSYGVGSIILKMGKHIHCVCRNMRGSSLALRSRTTCSH